MTTVKIYDARQNRVVIVEKIERSDAEWKTLLTKKHKVKFQELARLSLSLWDS